MRLTCLAAALMLAPFTLGAEDAARGAELYAYHCAACHGADATGDGPLAPVLIIQPSDLTTLAARNASVLPVIRIVLRIDGRDPLVSHGSPMPVYGALFDDSDALLRTEAGQYLATSEPVAALVAFIAAIQDPPLPQLE
ncbi:MAG: cytochrome c [Rubellimicrobium sp.]|nr:cytochrome c [Rubellimicrobium sp.]